MAFTGLLKFLKRTHVRTENAILERRFSSKARTQKQDLFLRISPLGDPDISLAPVIDKWVEEGNKINNLLIRRIVKELRSRRRYSQALEVSEWMSRAKQISSSSADHAVRLDLIGRVRGVESAESYFQNLDDQERNDKTYGALLSCYVREGLAERSLHLLQKMKDLHFASTALNYNDLMCLYTNTGQLNKVVDVLSDMKENGVSPDIFSYRISMNSCAARSDISGVEKILEEMENHPHISMDWHTYSAVASIYIKAGLKERAIVYLKKCEDKVNKNALGYGHLISHYANLGNKDEIMRLWGLVKTKCKKQLNRDYITMLSSLVKIEEFEEAEKLLQEWESSCYSYDSRVPNVILIGYCRKGLIQKAETMLRGFVKKQNSTTPDSWGIIAAGYMDKENMEKAFECMREALDVQGENKWWRPKPQLISSILSWLGDNGNLEDVESFVSLLETKVPKSREMYHALMNVYIRSGKQVDGLLASMKADDISEDKETENS